MNQQAMRQRTLNQVTSGDATITILFNDGRCGRACPGRQGGAEIL